jgi:CBS domain-containing protein
MSAAQMIASHDDAVIADLMSQPVLTVEAHETLWAAWQLLFVSGLRHLVVINADGSNRGVLSDRSILAEVPATADNLGRRTVQDIMAMVPHVSIHPRQTPVSAARLMVDYVVEAVPVVDDRGHVVGIVTEKDIVRWLVS